MNIKNKNKLKEIHFQFHIKWAELVKLFLYKGKLATSL